MDLHAAQSRMLQDLAELARTLGSPHRLALLQLIAQGERSVERLAEATGLPLANVSQHLQHLKRAAFVETRRDGKRIFYRLAGGPIVDLLTALTRLAEHNQAQLRALVTDSLHQRERLEAISRQDLLARLREGDVTLLDVRPQDEFAMGHLPSAINIPVEELAGRLAELPRDQVIVAYCRGPHCVLSSSAVRMLAAEGYRARLFDDGFPEWKAAGLDVVTPGQARAE